MLHAKVVIADWNHEYNHVRRHSSLNYKTPTARTHTSLRGRYSEIAYSCLGPEQVDLAKLLQSLHASGTNLSSHDRNAQSLTACGRAPLPKKMPQLLLVHFAGCVSGQLANDLRIGRHLVLRHSGRSPLFQLVG